MEKKRLQEKVRQTVSTVIDVVHKVKEGKHSHDDGWVMTSIRSVYYVITSFLSHRCLLLASSLSYTTVLSFVPFLAVAFAVTKAFGIYESEFIRQVLLKLTADRSMAVDAILEYIQNTNVKALGIVGVATLVFTAISLLSTIEGILNIIWNAKSRQFSWRKFSDYATVIVVCPIFIITAFSATASFENNTFVKWFLDFRILNYMYLTVISVMPLFMVWVALFILYRFLPNTNVSLLGAAIGAIFAGTLWQITQNVYISYQVGFAKYNAIYGSFAQIPLLLIWLYISWAIVLIGAETASAVQNYRTYRQDLMVRFYSRRDKHKLMLLVVLYITWQFEHGNKPASTGNIASHFGAPLRFVNEIMRLLFMNNILLAVDDPQSQETYTFAKPPDSLTIHQVLQMMDNYRAGDVTIPFEEEYSFINSVYDELAQFGGDSAMTLREFNVRFGHDLHLNVS
ncbi:YihY/virulence factor BrkB family protein [Desulfovibrio inopinatus]|uniref:YihY/virulence factor BrkB family protein n=1 Tax=Desulfovibrio inopinatus TaxID=102109 RepID=UPI001B7F7BD2|nr:YihY/virulence factor BrkB family protein [Desulfovibrio inopinatus]